MGKRTSLVAVVGAICLVAVGLAVVSQYRVVEVQSGTVVKCLDPKHEGDSVTRSSVKTLRVASKDAGSYGISVDSLVCPKCQAQSQVDEREARARKKKEDVFIAALRKHDDAVLLCCRHMAGIAASDPYAVQRLVGRDIRRLRSLALSGKQLCAPQSLADVESQYNKSMDEILASLPYIQKGVREVDVDAMETGKAHMVLSKQYRDETISGIEGR